MRINPLTRKLMIIFLLSLIPLLSVTSYTGFAVSEEDIVFDLDGLWNISNGFVRVSLNSQTEDRALSEFVSDGKIVVDLNKFNLSYKEGGTVYVDLIVDNVLVDSKSLDIKQEMADNYSIIAVPLIEEAKIDDPIGIDAAEPSKAIEKTLVKRTANTDHYYLGNGKYEAEIYSQAVNMEDSEGIFKPYTEVTKLTAMDNELVLEWNNKSIKLQFYIKDAEGNKENLSDMTLSDGASLDFKTSILENRGSYYFNHTLNKDYQPSKLGYDIITENVDCKAEEHSLICDEQKIDFTQAIEEQNLSIKFQEGSIEIQGDDLSYVDPSVYINDTNRQRVYYDSEVPIYQYSGDLTFIGNKNMETYYVLNRGYARFNISSIFDSVEISNISFKFNTNNVVTTNCSDGNVDVGAYDVPDGAYTLPVTSSSEAEALYGGMDDSTNFGDISSGGFDAGDEEVWHTVKLPSSAEDLLQEDVNNGGYFIIGIVSSEMSQVYREKCHVSISLTPNYFQLIVDYTNYNSAIENGITDAVPSATIHTDQQVYLRYMNGTQMTGTFDRVAVLGNQTWAFNYITSSESYTNMENMEPAVYIWENSSLTAEEIEGQVEALINSTKV